MDPSSLGSGEFFQKIVEVSPPRYTPQNWVSEIPSFSRRFHLCLNKEVPGGELCLVKGTNMYLFAAGR